MPCCYIIYSKKLDRFYTGATSEPAESRLEKHNSNAYGSSHFTSTANDWTLFLELPTDNMAQALKLEHKIKRMKSSLYIKNLKKYIELRERIYTQTRDT